MSELASLFNPSSVALVGATDRSTWSKMAFDNLRLLGFQGRVHLVSRSGGLAHGQQTFTSVTEIGEPVDVALLMLPIVDCIRWTSTSSERWSQPILHAALPSMVNFSWKSLRLSRREDTSSIRFETQSMSLTCCWTMYS